MTHAIPHITRSNPLKRPYPGENEATNQSNKKARTNLPGSAGAFENQCSKFSITSSTPNLRTLAPASKPNPYTNASSQAPRSLKARVVKAQALRLSDNQNGATQLLNNVPSQLQKNAMQPAPPSPLHLEEPTWSFLLQTQNFNHAQDEALFSLSNLDTEGNAPRAFDDQQISQPQVPPQKTAPLSEVRNFSLPQNDQSPLSLFDLDADGHVQPFMNDQQISESQLSPPTLSFLSPILNFNHAQDDQAPLSLFNKIIKDNMPSCIDKGRDISHDIERLKEGIQLLNRVPNSKSMLGFHLFTLGCHYVEQKDYLRAIGSFVEILSPHTQFVAAQLGIAICYFYLGNYSMAIAYARNKIPQLDKKEPGSDRAYYSAQFIIGCCSAKQSNYREAIKYFSTLPDTHYCYYSAQFNIGSCYYNQKIKNDSEAIKHFNLVIPGRDFYAAQYYLGVIYLAQDNAGMAINHLSKIRKTSSYFSSAQEKLNELKN